MSDLDAATNDGSSAPKLYRFVGLVFIWMVPSFALWVPLSAMLAAPAVWLTNVILTYFLPDVVHELTLNGTQTLLTTHFGELNSEIVSARLAGYRIAFPFNTQILTYSLPFYAALSYATPGGDSFGRFARGSLALYVLLIVGLISVSLKSLMLGLGPVFIDGFSTPATIIGISYQFSTLMVPPLAPVLVWAWQSRHSPLLQKLLVKQQDKL